MTKQPLPFYIQNPSDEEWWCLVHNRVATHLLFRKGCKPEPHCGPGLPGITIPCNCVPSALREEPPQPEQAPVDVEVLEQIIRAQARLLISFRTGIEPPEWVFRVLHRNDDTVTKITKLRQ